MVAHLTRRGDIRRLAQQIGQLKTVQTNLAFELLLQHLHGGGTEREMDRPARLQKDFQQAHTVRSSTGAAHR